MTHEVIHAKAGRYVPLDGCALAQAHDDGKVSLSGRWYKSAIAGLCRDPGRARTALDAVSGPGPLR